MKSFQKHLDRVGLLHQVSTYTFLQLKLKLYQKAETIRQDGKLSVSKTGSVERKHGREKNKNLVNEF